MSKIFSIVCLLVCLGLLQGCQSGPATEADMVATSPLPAETPLPAEIEAQTVSGGKAEFEGVSFDYNPQIFGDGKAEKIPAYPLQKKDDKPDENYPDHISFTLPINLQKNAKTEREEPEIIIKIVPIKEFRKMFAVSTDDSDYPGGSLMNSFDRNLSDVKKLIKNKDFRDKGEAPILPFWDSSQIFAVKVKNLSFQKGQGTIFLTEYSQDWVSIISNEHMECIFQGITDDGENYILAEFPVTTSFLPKIGSDDEFEGYKIPDNLNKENAKQYKQYVTNITKRLEALPANQFNPNLGEFENIITSLKIEK